jgi:hypothetical protein
MPPLNLPSRGLTALLSTLFTSVLLAPPASLWAQGVSVGAQVGLVSSRQLVRGGDPSQARSGFLAGAFVEVDTPGAWLGVLAEASFTRRGGRFALQGGQVGEVRADYLVFAVSPVVRRRLGAVSLFVYGGPSLETHLQVRAAAELAAAYREPSDQIFSAQLGAGLEANLAGMLRLRLEARHVEGLSPAFDSSAGEFRHRSRELLLRLGRSRAR